MTEQVAVPEAVAPEAVTEAPPEDPFEGLQSESFKDGEPEEVLAPEPVREVMGDAEGAEEAPLEPEPVKPKQTAQERINELTRLRREAERKAAALEARLQEMERPPEPETPPEPEPETPPEPEEKGPPDPSSFDYGELDPKYITALVEYQTDQRISAFRQEEAEKADRQRLEREHRAVQERFAEKVNSGGEKYDDFHEKVVVGAEQGEWALSAELGKMLVDSDVGDDIAYYLAAHPDESLEVYRQSPVEQARYFGKLEAKFSAAQPAAPGKAETKPPKAPPPVMPARGADGKFQPSADSEDFSAFERLANSQER